MGESTPRSRQVRIYDNGQDSVHECLQYPSSDGRARLSSTASSDAPKPPSGPKPAGSPQAAGRAQRLSQRASPESRRLTYALLVSLLMHTSLLSLKFGGQGLGLPGFGFPGQDRRIEAPDLRVAFVPAPVRATEPAVTSVAEPLQQASVEQPVARGPALTPSVSRAPTTVRLAPAVLSEANPKAEGNSRTEAKPRTEGKRRPDAKQRADAATAAAPAKARLRADRSRKTAPPPSPSPAVIALERTDEDTWVLPATPAMPPPVIAAAPSASSPETAAPSPPDAGDAAGTRIDPVASEGAVEPAKIERFKQEEQRQAEQLEAARAESARLETERQEAAAQAAALQEAARQTAARQQAALQKSARQAAAVQAAERQEAVEREAARIEAARRDAERQEAPQREATRQEAERQETARVEAARQAAALQEAARQEAAVQREAARTEAAQREAARVEAERRETQRQEAARVEAQEAAARREAALRAIGRQLDEEAAQRQAAPASADPSRPLPPPWTLRRYRLFGRTDPNQDIILYAEAWERKIHLNMTFDMVREPAKQPHTNPIVKVAIRSDGSVESVTFVVSSGVAALDNAIQRVIDSQKPYRVFPPSLAREYDVIEIRRTWHFDTAIRLY